jgi:hypothetical protein
MLEEQDGDRSQNLRIARPLEFALKRHCWTYPPDGGSPFCAPSGGYRCAGLVSKLPSSSLKQSLPGHSGMTILARRSVGRILLHLIAMLGDRSVRFHFEGIARELPWIASGLAMLSRAPSRLLAALTLYLAQPMKHSITDSSADLQSLAAVLKRGDVLLSWEFALRRSQSH